MSTCEFCNGRGIEPGFDNCAWCDNTGVLVIGERAVEIVQQPSQVALSLQKKLADITADRYRLRDAIMRVRAKICLPKSIDSILIDALSASQAPGPAVKCDGNHGGGQCPDPECWNGGDPMAEKLIFCTSCALGDGRPHSLNHCYLGKQKTVERDERAALHAFVGAAYPVAHQINTRGYNWSEAYLDEALAMASAALERKPIARNFSRQVGLLKIGIYGKAYDQQGTYRAYTYADQPHNIEASKLGRAAQSAMPGGDLIDGGLSLLKCLEDEGFGVFDLKALETKP